MEYAVNFDGQEDLRRLSAMAAAALLPTTRPLSSSTSPVKIARRTAERACGRAGVWRMGVWVPRLARAPSVRVQAPCSTCARACVCVCVWRELLVPQTGACHGSLTRLPYLSERDLQFDPKTTGAEDAIHAIAVVTAGLAMRRHTFGLPIIPSARILPASPCPALAHSVVGWSMDAPRVYAGLLWRSMRLVARRALHRL